MGGGNAQKTAMARAKKQEKMKAESKGAWGADLGGMMREDRRHRRHFYFYFHLFFS